MKENFQFVTYLTLNSLFTQEAVEALLTHHLHSEAPAGIVGWL